MINSREVCALLFARAVKKKKAANGTTCTGLLESQSKYVCALGLNGSDPTENRIRGCYRDTLGLTRLSLVHTRQRLAEQDRVCDCER